MNQQINLFCELINELRYRINNNISLDSKYIKIKESLAILIPMFNKLMENETIISKNTNEPINANKCIQFTEANANVNGTYIKTGDSINGVDENISVDELNKLSLELLQKFRLDNWILYTLKNNTYNNVTINWN